MKNKLGNKGRLKITPLCGLAQTLDPTAYTHGHRGHRGVNMGLVNDSLCSTAYSKS